MGIGKNATYRDGPVTAPALTGEKFRKNGLLTVPSSPPEPGAISPRSPRKRGSTDLTRAALKALADVARKGESEHAKVAAAKALLAFAGAGAASQSATILEAQVPDTETKMGALMARRAEGKK